MRFGEITKLEVIDIDFQNKLANLRDTKNGEDRVVPLNDRAIEICLRYRLEINYLILKEINSDIILNKLVEKRK